MMLSNSFCLQANAKNLIDINTMDELSIIENLDEEKILVLGAGTNVILSDYFDGTVIQVHLKDIEVHEDYISVGAGVDWAELIEYCLKNKLYGIENLTHIPGSVGAAPVQNIGASHLNSLTKILKPLSKKRNCSNFSDCSFAVGFNVLKC